MPRQLPFLRASEYVVLAFFSYLTVLAFLLPVSRQVALVTAGVNALVFGGLFLLAYADQFRRGEFLGVVRDWYVPPLALLAYREVGWFAQPHTSTALEESWVVWDRLLLNEWGLKAIIEVLGPVIPSILELSYSLVYVMAPFGLAMFYVYGKRERVDAFQFNFILSVLAVYTLYPYFPSEPPWTVFPGEDFPSYETIFRRFNGGLLRSQGIHTSVFPSAHVAGSFGVAFGLMRVLPEKPWVGRLSLLLAISIAIATVYGRYHYAVDALAGFGIAVVATSAGKLAGRHAATGLGGRGGGGLRRG